MVGNTTTGNKAAWNNGNVYTDHDGNINHYDANSSSWHTYGSSGWQKFQAIETSSWHNHESWGQSVGSDRFDSWNRSGGGGWGGFHGGGGWGGFHGGGGFGRR